MTVELTQQDALEHLFFDGRHAGETDDEYNERLEAQKLVEAELEAAHAAADFAKSQKAGASGLLGRLMVANGYTK